LELDLEGGDLGEEVLALLKQCSRLASLTLTSFFWMDRAVQPPADVGAALAQLPSLKELALWPHDDADGTTAAVVVAAAFSGLTSLRVSTTCELHPQAGIITAAANNLNLQDFSLLQTGYDGDPGTPTAAQLARVLTACPYLTSLDLSCTVLDDQSLEAVLTHGSTITSLQLRSIKTEASFAARACRWETIGVHGSDQPSVLLWAHLPLRTVTDLVFWGGRGLSDLQLPLSRVPDAQLAPTLRQAATNLASCPAWQADFKDRISVRGDIGSALNALAVFQAQQRIQLIEALAPMGGPAVKEVGVTISSATFQWGRPELHALARSLGGQVTSLGLGHCTLALDFWAALDECFPALTSLQLQKNVTCSATDVAIFCSTRPADRPFVLHLSTDVFPAVQGQQLKAGLAARGMAHVRVERVA
jgi:hypothetical protein